MWLPGDPGSPAGNTALPIERMLRVDHAGEYGAKRIYEGQLAVLRRRNSRASLAIRDMLEQELRHLEAFEGLLRARRVRPSLLMPLWHVGGWLLGAATARLGEEAAMACTVAVESVIDAHYAEQEEALAAVPEEAALHATIARFRADEQHHHATGLEHGAESAPLYRALHAGIAGLTRVAVRLASRF